MEEEHNELFQFHLAFGVPGSATEDIMYAIRDIKENVSAINHFHLFEQDANRFADLAWRLLGRYIANNIHLKQIELDECGITDHNMTLLFRELTGSTSLEKIDMTSNEFGIEGLRCMIPFLQNSPQLKSLWFGGIDMETEGFNMLINALDESTVKVLIVDCCNVTDISLLGTCNISNHLEEINLLGNHIGREGCIILSNLLQREGSPLKVLCLSHTGVTDEGAEIIATSLKHNKKLKELHLVDNSITEEGHKVFLKLLVDISSIESTYNSNHSLKKCSLIEYGTPISEMQSLIKDACEMNRNSNPGREKVINYQLNSQTRKKLCELQGIEYINGNIFADIEPILLPKILALIGERHGQSELYTALIPTAPDLLSYIDRKAMLKSAVTEKEEEIAALTQQLSLLNAKKDELSKRLDLLESGDTMQSGVGEGDEGMGSNKRQRS